MAITVKRYDWWLDESEDGHLDYTVVWLCVTDNPSNGPGTIRAAAGIPAVGSTFIFGTDSTTYVYARRPKSVKRVSNDAADRFRWYVTQVFSSRPLTRYDASGPISNPLLEPPIIRGNALKYMRRFTQDKDGNPLVSSSGERYSGPEVEDDDNNIALSITFNSASVNLLTLRTVLKTTPWNDDTLWGLPARTVRFTDYEVEKLYQGEGTVYYRQTLKFEIGGDYIRKVLDEGTMVYIGPSAKTAAQLANPSNYARAKDARGENMKRVPLNGAGEILTDLTSPVYNDFILKGESNLLLLGIPSSL